MNPKRTAWPDGSYIRLEDYKYRPQKWTAWQTSGVAISDDGIQAVEYPTPEAAADALRAIGMGPAAAILAASCYRVCEPYESHDGPVSWTVQRFEEGDDPEDASRELIAEFAERSDAELFAKAKSPGSLPTGAGCSTVAGAVTEEWLVSVGFQPDAYGLEVRNEDEGYSIGLTHGSGRWEYMGRKIPTPKTRQDVRELCRALGIELLSSPAPSQLQAAIERWRIVRSGVQACGSLRNVWLWNGQQFNEEQALMDSQMIADAYLAGMLSSTAPEAASSSGES